MKIFLIVWFSLFNCEKFGLNGGYICEEKQNFKIFSTSTTAYNFFNELKYKAYEIPGEIRDIKIFELYGTEISTQAR